MTAPATALPMFATVEQEQAAASSSPAATDAGGIAEAFRTLRTQVLLRARDGMRSFMLTSARPEEGKSTIAVNLAAALAAAGRHTLLVDGDLRRPSVHRLLGVPQRPGLADLLSAGLPLMTVVRPVSGRLAVLPSGRGGLDPQQLLLSPGLEASIAAMTARYEIVLFDSAPVLAVADASLLAAHAGGVIVVVRGGAPTAADLRLLRQRLAAAGASVIGSVLNRFDGPPAQDYHPYPYCTA